MQRVDPFIPVSKFEKPRRQPLAGLVNNVPHERPPQRLRTNMASVDGLVHPSPSRLIKSRSPRVIRERTAPTHREAFAAPIQKRLDHHAQIQQRSNSSTKSEKITRPHGFLKKLQTPAILLGIVIAGLLLQSGIVGMLFIAVYAIIVFTQHLESRVSFGLAFCALVTVVLLVLFKNGSPLITNFSLYAFVLLVVGAITLGREIQSTRP